MTQSTKYFIEKMNSPQFGALAETGTMIVLLPVGSVEPHGPHMSLATDTVISVGACRAAALILEREGLTPVIAPPIPYGVTECAAAFPGAISVPAETLTAMVGAIADAYLAAGALHVCLVNNHLEPGQDAAITAAAAGRTSVSVACPLQRQWGRTLTAEFKSGACHAGQYETSIILACDPSLVDYAKCSELPEVPISLSEKLGAGISDFEEMGLEQAYAGSPAAASATEGRTTLEALGAMIVGQVQASLEVES